MSPTARSLQWFKKFGIDVAPVEKWIPRTRQRKDAFGFGDLLAVDDEGGAILVQVTTASHVAARKKKIIRECGAVAARWLRGNNRIVVHGWAKKAGRWTVRGEPVTLADVDPAGGG